MLRLSDLVDTHTLSLHDTLWRPPVHHLQLWPKPVPQIGTTHRHARAIILLQRTMLAYTRFIQDGLYIAVWPVLVRRLVGLWYRRGESVSVYHLLSSS